MAISAVLLVVSFVLLLSGALVFTNAIEWAGQRLNLGQGAVGSILAAVATALPESVIPVIAVITGGAERAGIAIGAIIGAPFLLGTLAMFLVGVAAIAFRGRRAQRAALRLDVPTMVRDQTVFLVFLGIAVLLGVVGFRALNIAAAVVFLLAYGAYAWRTVAAGHGGGNGEDLRSLFFDPTKGDPPRNVQIMLQVTIGLGMILYGGHLFVTQIEHIATVLGVSALVLALVLAPLASELPEKANSFIWVRAGKDTLALGNISGAMVFQSMLPVAFGLAFTRWELAPSAVVPATCALAGGVLALVAVYRYRRYHVPFLVAWALLYAGAAGYVIAAP